MSEKEFNGNSSDEYDVEEYITREEFESLEERIERLAQFLQPDSAVPCPNCASLFPYLSKKKKTNKGKVHFKMACDSCNSTFNVDEEPGDFARHAYGNEK